MNLEPKEVRVVNSKFRNKGVINLLSDSGLTNRINSWRVSAYRACTGILVLCLIFGVAGYAFWSFENERKSLIEDEIGLQDRKLDAQASVYRLMRSYVDRLDMIKETGFNATNVTLLAMDDVYLLVNETEVAMNEIEVSNEMVDVDVSSPDLETMYTFLQQLEAKETEKQDWEQIVVDSIERNEEDGIYVSFNSEYKENYGNE